VVFMTTCASKPPASIRGRHSFEMRHLLEHWLQANGVYYMLCTAYTAC